MQKATHVEALQIPGPLVVPRCPGHGLEYEPAVRGQTSSEVIDDRPTILVPEQPLGEVVDGRHRRHCAGPAGDEPNRRPSAASRSGRPPLP